MRLQVFLSHSRICSRRKAMELVQAGRVSVQGKVVTEPSYEVSPGCRDVCLDGRNVEPGTGKDYLVLNKPRGVVTTLQDKYAESTVLGLLPKAYKHLYPVGRLDKDSQGLLLFTNDGELTFRLLHPSFKVDKVYNVRLDKPPDENSVRNLERGVFIEGRKTAPAKIVRTGVESLRITIHEGRKRQIRLMLSGLGFRVLRLERIKYGPVSLGNLRPGEWRLLDEKEVAALRAETGGKKDAL